MIFTLVALLMLSAAVSRAAPSEMPGRHVSESRIVRTGRPMDLEARIDAWVRDAMRLLHEGRPEEADQVAERLIRAAPEDPRAYLVQARVLREGVSDQNHARDSLKPQVASIHSVLEQCIALADEILDRDPDSPQGLLYRGWGKMFKAQLHALAFESWSAGRTAKSGKKDLDELLKHDPDNGDALMILGTYKYFADTLPAVMRFASFLLRIPGGDREEGLSLLERAGQSGGYLRQDAEGIRGFALFGFEGALERALPIFEDLSREYPTNPRFVEPIGLLALFFPERLTDDRDQLENAIRVGDESSDSRLRNVADRIRLYLALIELLSGRIDAARANLEVLHRNAPAEPDWLPPDIYRILVDVHLMLGETDRALALYHELDPERSEDANVEKPLRFVTKEDAGQIASDPSEVETLRKVEPIARALYDGRIAEAEDALHSLGSIDEPIVSFYRGELFTLQGRDAEAITEYRKLTEVQLPERWRLYRYFSRIRLAESLVREGDPERAANVLGDAADSYPIHDLLRHVTQARKRYFENFDEYARES
jgi:tetratricopeptide (TPR) repeat protein